MTLARKNIRRTTAAERNERRQRAEDKKALHANLALVRAGGEPTIEPEVAVDGHYLAWLREQRCGVRVAFGAAAGPCMLPIDPEHKREGVGMGRRAPDVWAWACCRGHHDDRHDGRGIFATLDRADLRTFIRMQIAMYRAAFTAHLASLPRVDATAPQPGDIAIGDPVSLGGSTGSIAAVLAPDRVRIAWLDGTSTEETIK